METITDISVFINHLITSFFEVFNIKEIPKSFLKFDVKNDLLPNITVNIYRDKTVKFTYYKNNRPVEVMLGGHTIHDIQKGLVELKELIGGEVNVE